MDQVCGAITRNPLYFAAFYANTRLLHAPNPMWLITLIIDKKRGSISLIRDQNHSSVLTPAKSIHLPLTVLEQAYR